MEAAFAVLLGWFPQDETIRRLAGEGTENALDRCILYCRLNGLHPPATSPAEPGDVVVVEPALRIRQLLRSHTINLIVPKYCGCPSVGPWADCRCDQEYYYNKKQLPQLW